ncbi:MAG: hypothetical protein ACR2PA_26345 [Hyphomicrobiaceae bacterium]
MSARLTTLVSMLALVFSGYSFYETVLKQASLRIYQPPLIHMFRQGYRDVLAIPITISNDGARRGTILSFDLEVTHQKTNKSVKFQNLHFGSSPKGDVKLFNPITVPGRSSYTGVVLFHALETGAFTETTGGIELPLQLKLSMNVDQTGDWFDAIAPVTSKTLVFNMKANFIQGFRDMEAGRPTRLHDERWHASKAKK